MSQSQGALDVEVPFKRVLVANRGDVAVRVFSTCRALGITTVGVAPSDDQDALHTRHCDELVTLPGTGPAAYLDVGELVAAAVRTGADALHPGWGFASESAELAQACYEAGVVLVGPRAETLKLLGDKARARGLARSCVIPVVPGTDSATELGQARAFWEEQVAEVGPGVAILLKARSGGGGRGIRTVRERAELEPAFRQATSEAQTAFGSGVLYVERLMTGVHHVEVQLAGDAQGRVRHLWDRECSIQRQHQKLVEVAPSPVLPEHARSRMLQAATRIGAAAGLTGLATVEFLATPDGEFWFMECNPRLQVEHTVTEQVLGLDLVLLQLQLAAGVTLADLGIEAGRGPTPRGTAIQVRLNAERVQPDASVLPATGTLDQLDLPSGAGVRVDPAVRRGTSVGPRYDSLLAKVVAHAPDLTAAVRLASHALAETTISGVATNLAVQRAVLEHPDLVAGHCDTDWFERTVGELLARASHLDRDGGVEAGVGMPAEPPAGRSAPPAVGDEPAAQTVEGEARDHDPLPATSPDAFELFRAQTLGAGSGSGDPTHAEAVSVLSTALTDDLEHERRQGPALPTRTVRAHLAGTVVAVGVAPGVRVRAGDELALLEAMKMQHPVLAPCDGTVARVGLAVGQSVDEGHVVVEMQVQDAAGVGSADLTADPVRGPAVEDPERLRADLQLVRAAHRPLTDAARPDAVAARHARGRRTARENIDAVTDDGLLVEYGGLAVAAQRHRRRLDDLVARTPADGIVTGLGRVNADLFGPERTTCAIAAYDYTVLAGTQGVRSHAKLDRILNVAHRQRHPVILFAEGGGGRPNDTDVPVVAGLHVTSFAALARLSGRVPLVGIAAGRCFAGNAALLGTCDVVIATEDSSIGMGGPAMIEGGGLGVVAPGDVGPIQVQRANGVVDVVVADEAEATAVARRYLGYFQGVVDQWQAPDGPVLRHVVPEERQRVYDVRAVIHGLADVGSVLELRRDFGGAAITALARIEGQPVGMIANQPLVNSGAIDAPAADKLARFVQLCDAFALPLVSLCDTPGFMVGPESEKQATVRHFPRLFVAGGNRTVPWVTVVLRKAYGLGAMAMAGGGFHETTATLAWPSAEFGAMGLDGAVRLGARDRLAAIEDPQERRQAFDALVAKAYERGSAINAARHLEIDDVIDPASTRAAVVAALLSRPAPERDGWINAHRHSGIDTW